MDLATEIGLSEALLMQHFYYWFQQNRDNEGMIKDGRVWCFSAVRVINEIFPYLSPQNIKTAINHLIRDGYLLKGKYNDYAWQHTTWYALSDKGLALFHHLGNQQMDLLNQQMQSDDLTEQYNNRNKIIEKEDNSNEFYNLSNIHDSIIDDSLNPDKVKKRKTFVKPTIEEVAAYCRERGNTIDPEAFIDHYESNGWIVGRSPMKDWKAAVRTWEKRRDIRPASSKPEKESLTDYYRKLYKQLGINPDGTAIGAPAQQTPPQYGRQPYDFAADFGIDEQ